MIKTHDLASGKTDTEVLESKAERAAVDRRDPNPVLPIYFLFETGRENDVQRQTER